MPLGRSLNWGQRSLIRRGLEAIADPRAVHGKLELGHRRMAVSGYQY